LLSPLSALGSYLLIPNDISVGYYFQGATRDVFLQGDVDEQFIRLATALGWGEEMRGHAVAGKMAAASTARLLDSSARGTQGGSK
jgi:hypothetical protein